MKGRWVSNRRANLENLCMGNCDSLVGFRVYLVTPLRDIILAQRWMHRFDFDLEATVRLCWRGEQPLNLPAPVR